ncbi:phage gp6-like head-tail connector protein [Variibacter gotjawalensis]|uniref:Phage gp6-like head-tail connector protein n=1 Tax=Variibacter gotjawalensis TaxID=1333996 RepID=A0A0S3PZ86_9BRAD|nr:head-tail connector protein [Variibacter gotjawalensis]NIK47064.1 putative phage protein (predicted DNA packaging) [Variibacter gotjawalensis]RZS48969.1 putative phage protein (predicted DNA packaging)/uncharacterized phiE125 gp8 family phage protein [Variibacter gotjawalensis]BAT61227.1 phage gp6-like head-tail connector protein [Variibacter gotjawalensis]
MAEAGLSASEPIGLDEAKAFLRVAHADEDALIGTLIAAARDYVETQTRRELAADVPAALRQAMRLLIAHWYEHRATASDRAAQIPDGVGALIAPYRELSL